MLFGAHVSFFDVADKSSDIATGRPTLKELIEGSDIVVLCASMTQPGRPILGKYEVGLLRGKFFVNSSRGELVDDLSLYALIQQDKIKGVALDVLPNETCKESNTKWFQLATKTTKLLLTPHLGGATYESNEKTEQFICSKLIEFLDSKTIT